ncbi:hypothetical protein ALP08_200040 [Pseudomonas syringae pv. pisi]|nr:hypothetical protein ALP08_200040 [Pseudomonas syringae pv. pisi]
MIRHALHLRGLSRTDFTSPLPTVADTMENAQLHPKPRPTPGLSQ